MKESISADLPLVSVIIPCYNHAHYLPQAIKSVQDQTYSNIEILVIDDGSTDSTKEVASQFPTVIYIYQDNKGLSSARNTGIRASKGNFLVFLDADDLLYDYSINYNIKICIQNPEFAFVSGAHQKISVDQKKLGVGRKKITSDHYLNFLKDNYIGMHGTVMFKRQVCEEFSYDESLPSSEDYDIYLKISRKYPVFHHTKIVALYRIYKNSMSGNIPKMLNCTLKVLKRQEPFLNSANERSALETGIRHFINYYTIILYGNLKIGNIAPTKEAIQMLYKYKPKFFVLYLFYFVINKNSLLSKINSSITTKILRVLGARQSFIPKVGGVSLGDFNRFIPFSNDFGYDRGGPIDRTYIENFLEEEKSQIKGRVLEIGDNDYTVRFGAERVLKSDILHIDESNPNATIIGDLSNALHINDNSFDCIILTQTLHLIYDFKGAIETCFRILKPAGTLLITVPGITSIDFDEWENYWLWSFTGKSVEKLLLENFPVENLEVNTYGNVFTATAFLYGMGQSEVKKDSFNFNDPHYQVIITAKATKPILNEIY